MLLAGDDDIGVEEDGRGEDQPPIALRRLVQEAHDLADAGLGGLQALLPVPDRMQFDPEPDALRDQLDQVGRDALVAALPR